jgi:hypothetical protein
MTQNLSHPTTSPEPTVSSKPIDGASKPFGGRAYFDALMEMNKREALKELRLAYLYELGELRDSNKKDL